MMLLDELSSLNIWCANSALQMIKDMFSFSSSASVNAYLNLDVSLWMSNLNLFRIPVLQTRNDLIP